MKQLGKLNRLQKVSFLFTGLFGILFTFTSWSFIGSLFFSGLSFSF